MRIGQRLLLQRVRRVVGAEDVGGAVGDAGPDAVAMRGVAHRRVHLQQRAEPRIVVGGEGQVMRRHLDGGDVLVVGEEAHLLGGRDVQHVDARAGLARDRDEPSRASGARPPRRARPDGSTDRRRRARRAARAGGTRPRHGRRRGGACSCRIARTPSSSATSRSPVDEPMNTLMPAAPGSRSSSGMSSAFSRVPPTQKAWSQCMRPRARASLSASAAAVMVSGLVFGISKTAVTPPITAAREPVSRSSLCSGARLAEMHLGVDDAGQDVQAAAVDRSRRRIGAGEIAERGDAAVADADVAQRRRRRG